MMMDGHVYEMFSIKPLLLLLLPVLENSTSFQQTEVDCFSMGA